ncbi:MAG: aminotransferase class V-fold PLP-dependent enzyme [Rhizobiales bacterium]|nr:aminotransferase class V-fold PLP-dependent enzyme [Hyphomicrobiales bacterium]
MPQQIHKLPLDLAGEFSRFRSRHKDRLHFAAHSHHFWPDVTRDAHLRYWDEAAELSDRKWEHILGSVWGDVSAEIARHLNLPDPKTLVPAPNTHELVSRILSCLPPDRPARILTSDSEFHSFARQSARLAEDGLVGVTTIPAEPFTSFAERFADAGRAAPGFDLIYFSQVFFSSGFAIDRLDELVDEVAGRGAIVVVDGYHGFLARPTDLANIADRIFYLAGGYKYAMAGEGACFMHCPPGVAPRPRNTGWYAGFGNLAGRQEGVDYDPAGWRFMGATFDPSGLYRMQASLGWLAANHLDARTIHGHARALQDLFLKGLAGRPSSPVQSSTLLVQPDRMAAGNFLTFVDARAGELFERLRRAGIEFDHRGDRLRAGFGLYHTAEDVELLVDRLGKLEP